MSLEALLPTLLGLHAFFVIFVSRNLTTAQFSYSVHHFSKKNGWFFDDSINALHPFFKALEPVDIDTICFIYFLDYLIDYRKSLIS